MHIWWIRRDLRLEDNPALSAALCAGQGVLPVFILDEHLLSRPAANRRAFLFAGLRELDARLRTLGSGLVVRAGDPLRELPALAAACGAGAVFAEADVSPYAHRRDTAVAQILDLRLVQGLGVHPTSAVTRAGGGIYTMFTPYSRAWKSLPFPTQLHPTPGAQQLAPGALLPSAALPDLPAPGGRLLSQFPPGEGEAQRRLAAFLDGPIVAYGDERNRMDLDGTSALSPYLRFGMLSARAAARVARQSACAGGEIWLNELIWREFYQSILYHFPRVLSGAFNPAFRAIAWRSAPDDLAAWQTGHTGYPVVDAAMRQLATSGWMHNRARMIAASFLVKHLLINWQEGERWFMRLLVDGDPAANNGGWQWTAGTGTDAAPYFRIFNPILQGQKFDPRGEYVRRWVPELAPVPQAALHQPWTLSAAEQRACGVIIGRDYPAPIVDHAFARQRALAAFSAARAK